jgi:hypothetical protein
VDRETTRARLSSTPAGNALATCPSSGCNVPGGFGSTWCSRGRAGSRAMTFGVAPDPRAGQLPAESRAPDAP